MISDSRFHEDLSSKLFASSGMDFTMLCVCIKLIQQNPLPDVVSSSYAVAKSGIAFLEATGYETLYAVQARLLLVLYELGHGLFPAASVSIGSCARCVRNMGLTPDSLNLRETAAAVTHCDAEERKRTWWAVHNLDRYDFTPCCG